MVGQGVSLIGCSSPLDVVWGFAKKPEVVVANTVVGPAEGKVASKDVVFSWILSFI